MIERQVDLSIQITISDQQVRMSEIKVFLEKIVLSYHESYERNIFIVIEFVEIDRYDNMPESIKKSVDVGLHLKVVKAVKRLRVKVIEEFRTLFSIPREKIPPLLSAWIRIMSQPVLADKVHCATKKVPAKVVSPVIVAGEVEVYDHASVKFRAFWFLVPHQAIQVVRVHRAENFSVINFGDN